MIRVLENLLIATRAHWFRSRGARIGAGCRLGPGVCLRPGVSGDTKGDLELGEACELERGAFLDGWGGRIVLGRRVWIGPYTVIYGHGGVEIGDQTLIAMHCRIVSSNHAIPPRDIEIRSVADKLLPTRIGRDVWLGAGVTVLGGVTIGDGCIVGAGAVVTGDLPPHSIAVGVPARVTGRRQS